MIQPRGLLLIVCYTAAMALPVASQAGEPAETAHPAPIGLAVLESEILADLPAEEQKALAGTIDTMLTESLAGRKEFILVDRRLLDKVLNEKKTQTVVGKGTEVGDNVAAAMAPENVPEPLRPFWAAGVLICPTIQYIDPENPNEGICIIVQAVAAQTGQLLAETHLKSPFQEGRWKEAPETCDSLQSLWSEIPRMLQQTNSFPLVEISDSHLSVTSSRLQWILDDLTDSLRAAVGAESGAVLLTPRQPLSTKEERLLRIMGLSNVGNNDPAAGLAASPNIRISVKLEEKSKSGVPFDAVAFTLTLKGSRRDGTKISHVLKGTVGKYQEIQIAAKEWLTSFLKREISHNRPVNATDQEDACRRFAQEELAIVRRMIKTYNTLPPVSDINHGWDLSPLKQGLRASLYKRALRICHLDPTNEEAAYVVALTIDSPYFLRGQERSEARWNRVILECQRYLDRFSGPTKLNDHRFQVLRQLSGVYTGLCDLRGPSGGWTDSPDQEIAFRYAEACLPAMAETDILDIAQAGQNTGNLWATANVLTQALFLTCPADRLNEQHQWWCRFWAKNIKPLKRYDVPTWTFAELGYHARKKDVQALRDSLVALGRKGPSASRWLWEGMNSPAYARDYLRVAGDPEWKTWRPEVVTPTDRFYPTFDDWNRLFSQLVPTMPSVWDFQNLPEPPVEQTVLLPQEVIQYGHSGVYMHQLQSPVELLATTDGWMWFSAPGPLRSQPVCNLKTDFRLYTCAVESLPKDSTTSASLQAVDWPTHPLEAKNQTKAPPIIVVCAATSGSRDDASVWIGTAYHGVAQFQRKGKRWVGLWYTTRNGLPGMYIATVMTCRHDGKTKMLLHTRDEQYSQPSFCVLDTDSGKVSVLGISPNEQSSYDLWAGDMEDGSRVALAPTTLADGMDIDLKNVKALSKISYRGQVLSTGTGKVPVLVEESGLYALEGRKLVPRRLLDSAVQENWIFYDDQTRFLGVGFFSRARQFWSVPSAPSLNGGVSSYWDGHRIWTTSDGHLLAYQPSWDANPDNDLWIGPFRLPDSGNAMALIPATEGGFWVTSSQGRIYRLNPNRVVKAAQAAGQTITTAKWKRQYEKNVMRGDWRGKVCFLIATRQWEKTIAILDDQVSSPKVELYRSLILARMGKHKQAARLYGLIAENKKATPTERALASVNQIKMLHITGQWQAMLDAADAFCSLFPDMQPRGNPTHSLDWYRTDACRKLVAEKEGHVNE